MCLSTFSHSLRNLQKDHDPGKRCPLTALKSFFAPGLPGAWYKHLYLFTLSFPYRPGLTAVSCWKFPNSSWSLLDTSLTTDLTAKSESNRMRCTRKHKTEELSSYSWTHSTNPKMIFGCPRIQTCSKFDSCHERFMVWNGICTTEDVEVWGRFEVGLRGTIRV